MASVVQGTRGTRPPSRAPSIGPAIAERRAKHGLSPTLRPGSPERDGAPSPRALRSQVRPLPGSELRRIAGDSSDRRRTAARHELEIRARRDAMCARQREWDDVNVPNVPGEASGCNEAADTTAPGRL
jgi:hypothetical protein